MILTRLEKLGLPSRAALISPCTLCGSEIDVEMLHLRAIKDVSKQPKDFMTAKMSRMKRKPDRVTTEFIMVE